MSLWHRILCRFGLREPPEVAAHHHRVHEHEKQAEELHREVIHKRARVMASNRRLTRSTLDSIDETERIRSAIKGVLQRLEQDKPKSGDRKD